MNIPMRFSGEWSTTPDPLHGDDGRVPSLFAARGYELFTEIGEDGFSPLALKVYRAGTDDEIPLFYINVEAPIGFETVAAATVPDLMDLLTQWAPAVQAADISQMIEALWALDDNNHLQISLRSLFHNR